MRGPRLDARGAILAALVIGGMATAGGQTLNFSSPSSLVDEQVGRAWIYFNLSGPHSQTVSVRYAAMGGSAAEDFDYIASEGRFVLPPGELAAGFSLEVEDDGEPEEDETIVFTLFDAVNASIGSGTHTMTILANDGPVTNALPHAYFASGGVSLLEGGGTATVPVALSAPVAFNCSVAFAVSGLSAAETDDFAPSSGVLTFPPNITQLPIAIPIVDDAIHETNEVIEIRLLTGVNCRVVAPFTNQATILDNDRVRASFLTATSSVDEIAGVVDLPLVLSRAPAEEIRVRLSRSGSAQEGMDYAGVTNEFRFPPGVTSGIARLRILDDEEEEAEEEIALQISSALGAQIATARHHRLTIRRNDAVNPAIQFEERFSSARESTNGVAIAVALSRATLSTVTVRYAVAPGGSATGGGTDYSFTNGTLAFLPGELQKGLAVTVVDDAIDEVDESFTIVLESPTNGHLGPLQSHRFWIVDDDTRGPVLQLFRQDVKSLDEANTLTLVGPLSANQNLRGIAVDRSRNFYITDQGPTSGKEEGAVWMMPAGDRAAVRILRGLTEPGDIELTPDQTGFVVITEEAGILRHSFGLSLRVTNRDAVALGARLHVFSAAGERVIKPSEDGYFHVLDLLGGEAASESIDLLLEMDGARREFPQVPLGQPNGDRVGHRIVEVEF